MRVNIYDSVWRFSSDVASGGYRWRVVVSGGGGGLRQSFRRCGHVSIWRPTLSGIAMFMVPKVGLLVCVMSIWKEGICAGKGSVYLSKRINSSLLTKKFISWH